VKSDSSLSCPLLFAVLQDLTAGHGEGSGTDLAVANGTGSGTAVFVGSGSGEGTGFLVGRFLDTVFRDAPCVVGSCDLCCTHVSCFNSMVHPCHSVKSSDAT
jgi:hypothetical protein